ncbi:MAG: DUF1302 family protein [Burkholderiaceae bacterium]|nr:DUF1302 family protein [Burkholderiaceae bacterium]
MQRRCPAPRARTAWLSARRYSVRPALRADWNKSYFAQVAYTRMGGGNYNLLADRSNLVVAAGMHF